MKWNFLKDRHGPLTQELVQSPGGFGLGLVPSRLIPDGVVTSICGYCSTGCGLSIHTKNDNPINLSPTTEYPVNLGMACPKGWEALVPLKAKDRAKHPMVSNGDGTFNPVSWNEAVGVMRQRFQEIQKKHGPDSLAFISTGQIVMEEMALLGVLAKFGMGIIHGDGNTRQCMATAATAYKQSFGFDAPPFTYKDFEESDVIILIGSNLCIAHPILWQRVCQNPNQPQIIVIDPRKTETAMAATLHLAPKPKSDLHLFYAIANELISKKWISRDYIDNYTEGFNDFATHVKDYSVESAAIATGLTAEAIHDLVQRIHHGKKVSFWWTMGVNQSHQGTRTAQAIINLALMTGNIGRPGTGANSITGQCNAMGSRLFSNTTNLIGGHDFTNLSHREKIASIIGVPIESIPDRNSWSYDQIMAGIHRGEIKGLWVIATNPAHSWIDQDSARKALKQLDCLVVQDMYESTETAQLADIILPAAGWGEKEGCFINSERRIGLNRKVAVPPGEALPDFDIFRLIAQEWGASFVEKDWSTPEQAFKMLQRISKNQPCDITGINGYKDLEQSGGIQWPLNELAPDRSTEKRLFEDGKYFHLNGKAKFLFESDKKPLEAPDDEFPLWLLTGRGSSAQWHTLTRTNKSPVLRRLAPTKAYIEIHPDDALKYQLVAGGRARIYSRRASIDADVMIVSTVPVGHIFLPMHYEQVNRLTFAEFDPYSRQPAYKTGAVRVMPVTRTKVS